LRPHTPGGVPGSAGKPLILGPVSYSEPSYAALRLAADLAGPLRARLLVLRVLPIQTYAMSAYPTSAGDGRVALETKRLESFLGRLMSEIGALPDYDLAIAFGLSRHRRIAEIAAEHDAQLIVMGARRGGLRRLVFGSLAERTRRVARCPILSADPDDRAPRFG